MIQVYADTARLSDFERYADDDAIAGFTCNPTVCRQASVKNYEHHVRTLLGHTDKPVSIQVTADELDEIDRQAHKIARFADHAVVKVPVVLTDGTPTHDLVRSLSSDGILVNVTAVFTSHQIVQLASAHPHIVSIFAGRIADTGVDPTPIVQRARSYLPVSTKVLWASPRSVYDYYWAHRSWADIVTLTPSIIAKLELKGLDLEEFSRRTSEQFHISALTGGYQL